MSIKKLQAPSIIFEWETVQDGGVQRAEKGLREVSRQLAELQPCLDSSAEIIVCYEEKDISQQELRSLLDRAAEPANWACSVILVPVPSGTHYYEKKNAGARASGKGIIVFLDTDLLPDPDWLRNLLTAFDDWSTSVLLGATHLDHGTLYEMAVALSWIFPPATYGRGIQPLRRYSSNNLAFRRAVFQKFPFPSRPTYRGQCGDLGKTLLGVGIPIREHTDARASHPPPAGFQGFVHRAWSAGKDEQFYASLEAETSFTSAVRQMSHDYRIVARRIRERRNLLKPGYVAHTLAWLLGWAYYTIKTAGYLSEIGRKTIPAPSPRATA